MGMKKIIKPANLGVVPVAVFIGLSPILNVKNHVL